MTRFIAFVLLFSLLSPKPSDEFREAIRAAVERQMAEYPESTLKDIYMNFFQDEFGPGPLMDLENECAQAAVENNLCREVEPVGWHERYYRVNLSLINDGKIPFDVFLDAAMESAGDSSTPDVKEWSREWKTILSVIRKMKLNLPSYASDRKEINDMLSKGEFALHHSEAFVDAYHPHYRLIRKGVFEMKMLPYLDDVR